MELSDVGVDFVKRWEGYSGRAYQDTGGVWTIGWGTTRYEDGSPVAKGDVISEARATELLRHDMRWAVESVERRVTVPLTQAQFDALVSFVYNIGDYHFAESGMLRKLNAGDYAGAINEFPKWKYDNGKIIPGLVNRRSDEQDLFISDGADPRFKKDVTVDADMSNPLDPTAPPIVFGDKDPAKKI